MSYVSHLIPDKGQHSKDRIDQIANNAGGFVYDTGDWGQLDRFLVIGSEGGTYYVGEKKLTVANAKVAKKLLDAGTASARRVIDRVVEISEAGRAPKNDPSLLVLALALSSQNPEVVQYASQAVPKIARTATMLFSLVDDLNQLRRWGRGLRKAVAQWYNSQTPDRLAHQVCKYQSRTKEGSQTWSHKDVLRKAHVRPATVAHSAVMRYVTKGWSPDQVANFVPSEGNPFNYIHGHELAKRASSVGEVVPLIERYGLVRESIPTQYLNSPEVWVAMLRQGMPMHALLRNLPTMTRNGVIGPMAEGNRYVCEAFRDRDVIKKARLHPLAILNAMKVYASGQSVHKDKLGRIMKTVTWTPNQSVLDAGYDAFYLAFDTIVPTHKRIMLAVDCSDSMRTNFCGGMPNLQAREVAAALALATAKTESRYMIVGFTAASLGQWMGYSFAHQNGSGSSEGIQELPISPRMRLDSVCEEMKKFPWGGTDCALPMKYAARHNLEVDAFVVLTDNETYAGTDVKADEALRQYRRSSGVKDAKLAVVGCTATNCTIADPRDRNMIDFVGADTATPGLLADFIRGDL